MQQADRRLLIMGRDDFTSPAAAL